MNRRNFLRNTVLGLTALAAWPAKALPHRGFAGDPEAMAAARVDPSYTIQWNDTLVCTTDPATSGLWVSEHWRDGVLLSRRFEQFVLVAGAPDGLLRTLDLAESIRQHKTVIEVARV